MAMSAVMMVALDALEELREGDGANGKSCRDHEKDEVGHFSSPRSHVPFGPARQARAQESVGDMALDSLGFRGEGYS